MHHNNFSHMILETIRCPCCSAYENILWAEEIGFKVVRCLGCGLLYVNPRPKLSDIESAVRTGEHSLETGRLNVRSRRIPKKVAYYKRIFANVFSDLWQSGRPILWVDVGSGYGETLEAVASLAPPGSTLVGVEPMSHKAEIARKAGLTIVNSYLEPGQFKANIISTIDIFSHIPEFHSFLKVLASNLAPGGEVFIESGNLADLKSRSEFPGGLGLPDHLVFAGEEQLMRYLNDAGFDVLDIRRERIDGIGNFVKNLVKKIIGQSSGLGVPYTSRYRQIRFRARLRSAS
jgi:Zn ribbon nucleic-acid-binding protein